MDFVSDTAHGNSIAQLLHELQGLMDSWPQMSTHEQDHARDCIDMVVGGAAAGAIMLLTGFKQLLIPAVVGNVSSSNVLTARLDILDEESGKLLARPSQMGIKCLICLDIDHLNNTNKR